ncbi:family 16 glycosylhydrolase (plasmid) [Sinorhizobium meliloti]|nr:family 16 glycosylhydrolase [Sinorhizobium meliloti]
MLTITAAPASESIQAEINGYDYTSGMLTTTRPLPKPTAISKCARTCRTTRGVWPAFWLLPADGFLPPELDVVEMRGQDPNTVIATVHSNENGIEDEHRECR